MPPTIPTIPLDRAVDMFHQRDGEGSDAAVRSLASEQPFVFGILANFAVGAGDPLPLAAVAAFYRLAKRELELQKLETLR